MEKFWVVWVDGKPSPTHQHPNNTLAFAEAERLVKLNPEHIVYVLEATDVCRIGIVSWERLS